jgi:hypothetical protein
MYGYDYKIDGTRISIRSADHADQDVPRELPGRQPPRRIEPARDLDLGVERRSTRTAATAAATTITRTGQPEQPEQRQQPEQPERPAPAQAKHRRQHDLEQRFLGRPEDRDRGHRRPKDGGRSVVVSPQSGVIVIRAMPDELRNVDVPEGDPAVGRPPGDPGSEDPRSRTERQLPERRQLGQPSPRSRAATTTASRPASSRRARADAAAVRRRPAGRHQDPAGPGGQHRLLAVERGQHGRFDVRPGLPDERISRR